MKNTELTFWIKLWIFSSIIIICILWWGRFTPIYEIVDKKLATDNAYTKGFNAGIDFGKMQTLNLLVECEKVTDPAVLSMYLKQSELMNENGTPIYGPTYCGPEK